MEILDVVIFLVIGAAAGHEQQPMDDSVLEPPSTMNNSGFPHLRGREKEEHGRSRVAVGIQLQERHPKAAVGHSENVAGPQRRTAWGSRRVRTENRNSDACDDLTIHSFRLRTEWHS